MRFVTVLGAVCAALLVGCSGARSTPYGDGPWTDPTVEIVTCDEDLDRIEAADLSWEPPYSECFGEAGWQDSAEPLCRPDAGRFSDTPIWADDRGVFVLLPGQEGSHSEPSLVRNDGTGWRVVRDFTDSDMLRYGGGRFMTGFPGGDLLVTSDVFLVTVDPSTGEAAREGVRFDHVFIHDGSLGYAVSRSEPAAFRFDSDGWAPLPGDPIPFEAARVWGDADIVFAVGENGMILSGEDGSWTVHDTGTTDGFSSVWGFSPTNVFAGTVRGDLYHYDGSSWERVTWHDGADRGPCDRRSVELWGAPDGTLFVQDGSRLVRIAGGRADTLWQWFSRTEERDGGTICVDGLIIVSMWGTSPTDVFLVIEGTEEGPHLCEEFVLWWDGTSFHWF